MVAPVELLGALPKPIGPVGAPELEHSVERRLVALLVGQLVAADDVLAVLAGVC